MKDKPVKGERWVLKTYGQHMSGPVEILEVSKRFVYYSFHDSDWIGYKPIEDFLRIYIPIKEKGPLHLDMTGLNIVLRKVWIRMTEKIRKQTKQ